MTEAPKNLYQLEGVPLPPVLSEHEPSWTLGLDYQLTPETLLYIAQRGGFESVALTDERRNTSTGTRFDSFKPEIARDLELVLSMPDDWCCPSTQSTLTYMRRESGCAGGRIQRACRGHGQCQQDPN